MITIKSRLRTTLWTLTALLISTSCYAAPYQMTDDAWKIEIAPYVWAISMNGTSQTGPVRVHVSQSFSDILSQLNFAGMLWGDISKGKLDIFANAMYAVLSDSETHGPISGDLRTQFGLFSGGVSYEVYRSNFPTMSPWSYLTLNPYAGFRYTLNNASLSVQGHFFKVNASDNQDWTDPIVGLRLNYYLNKAWSLIVAGDVGGTSTNTDSSYNVMGLIGYKPQTHWTNTTLYLGYRLLDQHYEHGSGLNHYDWNMKIAGPLLGIAILV